MVTNKDHVRELYQLKRERLPETTRIEMDLKVKERFFETFNFEDSKVVHTYLPIARRIEVDTFPIVKELASNFPKVRIALPYTNISEGRSLTHYFWKPGNPLLENKWHIPEPDPDNSTMVDIQDIDLVIVPLLAFDKQGHRIGYGAGYYDRFLADCKDETIIVGLSHFTAEDQWIKSEEYDIDLDCCITPDLVYKF